MSTQNLTDLVRRDVIGEATDEEEAMLRSDDHVRQWYAELKLLRQETEREPAEVVSRRGVE